MKVSKNMLSMLLVIGILLCGTNVFAASTVPKTLPQPKPIAVPTPTSTPSQIGYITFKKDEYVRITQPTQPPSEGTIVFNSQLNVMGEARVGANILVKVYTRDKEQDSFVLYKTYEAIEVGASQTFNQLVDLKVGQNKIVVNCTNKKVLEETIEVGNIIRQSEEVKDDIKNSIPDLKQPFLSGGSGNEKQTIEKR